MTDDVIQEPNSSKWSIACLLWELVGSGENQTLKLTQECPDQEFAYFQYVPVPKVHSPPISRKGMEIWHQNSQSHAPIFTHTHDSTH